MDTRNITAYTAHLRRLIIHAHAIKLYPCDGLSAVAGRGTETAPSAGMSHRERRQLTAHRQPSAFRTASECYDAVIRENAIKAPSMTDGDASQSLRR